MATLAEIRASIQHVLVDTYYYTTAILNEKINDALQAIAGGIIMPYGEISPPLPDLYASETLHTSTSLPYIDLPDDYQRHVFHVSDSSDYIIHPVQGGDYYSFKLFMNRAIKKDLSLPGMVTSVCVKGSKLYYQGIPSASTSLNIQYYRTPEALALDADIPEGLPGHLAKDVLKHYVLKEAFGASVEDGSNSERVGQAYHEKKLYELMTTMIRFFPSDDEPEYFAVSGCGYDPRNDL